MCVSARLWACAPVRVRCPRQARVRVVTETARADMFKTLALSMPNPRPAFPNNPKEKAHVKIVSDHSDQNPLAYKPHSCILITKSLSGLAHPSLSARRAAQLRRVCDSRRAVTRGRTRRRRVPRRRVACLSVPCACAPVVPCPEGLSIPCAVLF